MIAIVLIGVMVDRSALTLRNLALAALFVMLLAPEAVVLRGSAAAPSRATSISGICNKRA